MNFDFSTIDLSFAPLQQLQVAVEYFDQIMTKTPSREVADVCNFLQDLVEAIKKDRDEE